jgi:hypothetical protein
VQSRTRMTLSLPIVLFILVGACAPRDPGFITPGMIAPNCDGIEHPEENPGCPEWVSPRQKPMSATPAPPTPK